jgi:hypothetical protein
VKTEPVQCSEKSAYNIQTPGNYPDDNTLHPQHGESLKTTLWKVRQIFRLVKLCLDNRTDDSVWIIGLTTLFG